ncbi:MAG TPA: hypothetical protein PLU66_04305 [Trueperaceae bacterium]|nr:hypothetical protein [Trueperaceae bacterium]
MGTSAEAGKLAGDARSVSEEDNDPTVYRFEFETAVHAVENRAAWFEGC